MRLHTQDVLCPGSSSSSSKQAAMCKTASYIETETETHIETQAETTVSVCGDTDRGKQAKIKVVDLLHVLLPLIFEIHGPVVQI